MILFRKFILIAISLFLLDACVEDEPVRLPKPRMYPRVDFPTKDYNRISFDDCPYSFEIPTYSTVNQDKYNGNENKCWFNIDSPMFSAQVHCSYHPINSRNDFDKLVGDAYTLVQEHNRKADFIDQHDFKKDENVSGVVFNIEGPAASPFQFYLTDSTHHFIRGALYFNTQARPDSLRPIKEFMQIDVIQMLNTFEWE